MRRRLGAEGRIDAVDLLRWPGVVMEAERDGRPLAAVDRSSWPKRSPRSPPHVQAKASASRRCSPRAIAGHGIIGAVGARLPEVQARIRAKMQERLAALGVEVNPERLEQEIAMLLQKMDVAEELDRLKSHVTEFSATLASGDAVGRKLDFLMQEFNREANTLSSKSQDVETTRPAVELKVLIEQMREQVQNVE